MNDGIQNVQRFKGKPRKQRAWWACESCDHVGAKCPSRRMLRATDHMRRSRGSVLQVLKYVTVCRKRIPVDCLELELRCLGQKLRIAHCGLTWIVWSMRYKRCNHRSQTARKRLRLKSRVGLNVSSKRYSNKHVVDRRLSG